MDREIIRLQETKVKPVQVNEALAGYDSAPIVDGSNLLTLMRRPELAYSFVDMISPAPEELDEEMKEQVEIQIKYAGYIEKQLQHVEKLQKMEKKKIPEDINYNEIHGLAMEARQKLTKIAPISIGQASRIGGVTPADISILLVHLEHYNRVTAAKG